MKELYLQTEDKIYTDSNIKEVLSDLSLSTYVVKSYNTRESMYTSGKDVILNSNEFLVVLDSNSSKYITVDDKWKIINSGYFFQTLETFYLYDEGIRVGYPTDIYSAMYVALINDGAYLLNYLEYDRFMLFLEATGFNANIYEIDKLKVNEFMLEDIELKNGGYVTINSMHNIKIGEDFSGCNISKV